jgi:glycosyltransferase involved in cell wall biosynthesis
MSAPVRVLELRSVRGTGGGPEKTILLGTAATDRRRFEITVCYLRDQRDDVFGIDEWASRVGVDYVELRERHSFDFRTFTALRRLVRERRIDIVHAHDYKTDLFASLLAGVDKVRVLSTVHGWTGHSARERFVYYPVDKRVLARFPRLIAVSSEIRAELVRCGARAERVTVVLNGIDHRRFDRDPSRQSAIRSQFGIGGGEIVVGGVGRLEPQKRFDILIDAFARLLPTLPRLRLVIAGDGGSRASLERQVARLNLGHACRLLGHCSDVATLHHAFDLFVQSSDYEGTPNSVLEAMALQTPIVATDVGGTAELVTDRVHGLIVRRNDVEALRGAIELAIVDRTSRLTRVAAARRRVESDLSFERRMQRVEAVYDDLMSDGNGAPLAAVRTNS